MNSNCMKVKYAGKEIVILVIYLLNRAFRSVLTEWSIETRKFYEGLDDLFRGRLTHVTKPTF